MTRVDGPCRGPIYFLHKAGFRMSGSAEPQVESSASVSVAVGASRLVLSSSAGEMETDSDLEVEVMDGGEL